MAFQTGELKQLQITSTLILEWSVRKHNGSIAYKSLDISCNSWEEVKYKQYLKKQIGGDNMYMKTETDTVTKIPLYLWPWHKIDYNSFMKYIDATSDATVMIYPWINYKLYNNI